MLSRTLVIKRFVPLLIPNRGVRKTFRTQIPKYKEDLRNLPPLTGALTKLSEDPRLEKLEVYRRYLPSNSNTNLLEALLNPKNDIDQLLNIIEENLYTMTSFYLGIAFEALDDEMRINNSSIPTVVVAPEFKKLCERCLYKIRHFESDDILKLIKCISTVKLPEETLLVQAALTITSQHINDFNTDELDCLQDALDNFIITQHPQVSLLAAIKNVIPLARQRQLEELQFTRINRPTALPDETR